MSRCSGHEVTVALWDDGESLEPTACPERPAVDVPGVGPVCPGCAHVYQALRALGLRPRRHISEASS